MRGCIAVRVEPGLKTPCRAVLLGQPTKADKLEALAASAGTWRGRGFTGSEYVDSVRGDLAERLSRLGLE